MGLIELIIIVLLILWLLGWFGRGRWYATGPAVTTGGWAGNWVHLILVLVVILIVLRLLGVGV
jgi:hypothetical protein